MVALSVAGWAAPALAIDLAGAWKHERTKMSFKIKAWGPECGPRPQTENRKERGKVVVSVKGDKVELKKRRWKFGTHRCLSRNPEIKFRNYASATRTTQCSTAPGNSKEERGTYVLKTPDDNTIRYEGVTVYDWSLKGVSCQATMKEIQLFARAEPVAPPPPPPPPPPPVAEVAPPPPPPPAEAVVAEVVEEIVDQATGKVTRRRRKKGGGWVLDLETRAGQGGAKGSGGLADERQQVGTASARRGAGLALVIVLAALAISLFAGAFLFMSRKRQAPPPASGAGGGGGGGGSGVGGAGGGEGGGRDAAGGDASLRGPPRASARGGGEPGRLQVALSGAVAPPPPPLAQSGAGGRMLCPKCHRDFDPAARFCPHDAATLRRASRAAPGAEFMLSARLVCRTCLQEYPLGQAPEGGRCPADGDSLLPLVGAEARVAPASEVVGAADDPAVEVGLGRICPKCAARYAAGVVYCGRDGAELVPVH